MGLQLRHIEEYLGVRAVGTVKIKGRTQPDFIIDSRKLKTGDVFIAIRGQNHDAHDFITRELREKASLVIVNQVWFAKNKPSSGRFIPVKDTVDAMLKLASKHREALGLKVIGVTGSNGKTTARTLISQVLRRKYRVFETAGNFNNRIGLPLSVFQLNPSHQIAVLEMGTNHFGEIEELAKCVRPDAAVITNIGRGHLEFLKNRRGVLKAKVEILSGMPDNGLLVVNGDDDLLNAFKPPSKIRKLSCGFVNGRHLKGSLFKTGVLSGSRFLAGKDQVSLNLPGLGAAQDALLALLVGREFGVPVKEGITGLKKVKVPSDRMEIKRHKGITWIVDCYNANPDSLKNALMLMKDERLEGRKIAILGNMGELGPKSALFHREAGALVKACGFDVLLTLGQLGREIASGASRAGLVNCHAFSEKSELICIVRSSLRKGDVVLVKGSHSMRMEEIVHALI